MFLGEGGRYSYAKFLEMKFRRNDGINESYFTAENASVSVVFAQFSNHSSTHET